MTQQNIMDSLIKEDNVEVGVAEETKIEKEISQADLAEFDNHKPNETSIKFRNQLSEEDLATVVKAAPGLSEGMVKDYNKIIDFGSEVMEDLNQVSSRMLEEQKGTSIPEADKMVNGIMRELDGYQAKYGDPKTRKFLNNLLRRIKGSTYTVKNMVRDAKPITAKLDIVSAEIYEMEHKLKDNVLRGNELRKITAKTIDDVVKVLALFEEIIEVTRADALEMEDKLNVAKSQGDDSVIMWKDEKYTIEEFNNVLENQVTALGEMEKTWFAWRQKFFIYTANVASIRNIVNISIGLQRTCRRVRTDAIPAAKHQITAWQQAELANQGAQMANRANEGVDKLIAGASKGMADAVEAGAEANQKSMTSEQTVLAVTENLKRQFSAIVESEKKGREARAKTLELIEASEKVISEASEDSRKQLIENAMAVIRADNAAMNKKDADDVLAQLQKK